MSIDIRLKHSATANKAPQPADLKDGELALNTNAASPAAYIKDSAGNIVKLAGVGSVSTPDASETVKGIAELATQAEVTAGTDDQRIVTPLKLATAVPAASETDAGKVELATAAETTTGTDDTRAVHPAGLKVELDKLKLWSRTGTKLSPANAGDDVEVGDWLAGTTAFGARIGGAGHKFRADSATATVADFFGGTGSFSTDGMVLRVTGSDLRIGGGPSGGGGVPWNAKFTRDGILRIGGTLNDSTTSPNIELKPDGTSYFDNTITLKDPLGAGVSDAGVRMTPTGSVSVKRAGSGSAAGSAFIVDYGSTRAFLVEAQGTTKIGGTLPAAPNISLNANGSAEINGQLTLADFSTNDYQSWYGPGTIISKGGRTGIKFYSGVDGGLNFYNHTTGINGGFNFCTGPDGSAEKVVAIDADGTTKIGGTLPAAPNISLNANGSAAFAGTVTATVVPPSDQKFKENIAPANSQLADVVALGSQLKNFDWNADAPVNDEIRATRQLGLIAQDAEKVCPGLVKTIKRTKQGKELTPEQVIPAVYKDVVDPQDEENFIQELVTPEQIIPATHEELDDSYKGISHDALIMKLLGAIAELKAEVDALKAPTA